MSQAPYGHAGTSPGDRGEIDLSALAREVGRAKWLILLATILAAVVSTVAVSSITPRYTAETRILVENRDTEYTRFGRDSARGNDPAIDQEQVQSQVQLVTSRDLAAKMIERFDLGSKREFDRVIDGVGIVTRIAVMLGLVDNPANVSPQERVLESYFDKLKAFALTRSRVLAIEFQSRDPELASRLSNAIAEEYILQLEAAKKGTAQSAGGWLARTIEPLRQRVAEAEAKVETFRTMHGLFQSGENTTISTQQLSELNTQLATARAQQAELSSKARIIREAVRQGRIFEVSDVVNNEVVRRLIERRAELKAQIAQEGRTLLPQHPRIRELEAQLGGLEEQVRAAAERTARALENDSRAAGARVAASQAELDQQKRQSGVTSEAEVQLRVLEREAKAEREQLETYLSRYRDASVRNIENAVAADARIVSRATVPSAPTFPKRLPIIIIATLAGFILSLFLVLTRALLSDRIYVVRPAAPEAATPAMHPMATNPYAMPPHMLQAFYAQQAEMMARMMAQPAAAAAQPAAATAAAAAPDFAYAAQSAVPAARAPAAPDPMRQSLERMRQSISAGKEARAEASSADAMTDMPLPPRAPVVSDAPSMIAAEPSACEAPFSYAAPDEPPASDPIGQVADAVASAMVRGRPVSVLALSAFDAGYAEGSLAELARRMARRGKVQVMTLDPSVRTPAQIDSLVRSLSGRFDFLLMNGGPADGAAAALSRASAVTLLVVPDDILDPRGDDATRNLAGCSYFMVGPVERARATT